MPAFAALPVLSATSSIASAVSLSLLLNLSKSFARSFWDGNSTLSGSIPLKFVSCLNTLLMLFPKLPKPPAKPTTTADRPIRSAQNGCATTKLNIADSPARALLIRVITPAIAAEASALTLNSTHAAAAAVKANVKALIAVALLVIRCVTAAIRFITVVRIGAKLLNRVTNDLRTGPNRLPAATANLAIAKPKA